METNQIEEDLKVKKIEVDNLKKDIEGFLTNPFVSIELLHSGNRVAMLYPFELNDSNDVTIEKCGGNDYYIDLSGIRIVADEYRWIVD